MSYALLNSTDWVQVYSPTLVDDALLCTIQSYPSGSVLVRIVPRSAFVAGSGGPLCASLSERVEQLIAGGRVIGASGRTEIDASNLLTDVVDATVIYDPGDGRPGLITGQVTIPVNVLTADTSFGSFLSGGSAEDMIDAEVSRLQAMANG